MPDSQTKTPPTSTNRTARFLFHFGDFLAFWSSFDMIIEVLIMRELNIDEEKTCIVCAGLGFGAKISIAVSLLNNRPCDETKRAVSIIREAQTLGERNSFAHGFFLINRKQEKFALIKREVRDNYTSRIREIDADAMQQHMVKFNKKVRELQAHTLISDEDMNRYAKFVEARAREQTSLDRPRPAPQTSSAKAKRKRRP